MEDTYTLYTPQSRYADTMEITLGDILTTEDQGARDAEQLAAVADWLKESN